MDGLESFIVRAKANGWVGSGNGGKRIPPSKRGSADIIYEEGDWHYHDAFVGFSDFCGQEHVTFKGEPVWSMVYYGYLLDESRCGADQAVDVLKEALGAMYAEGRFLGGFVHRMGDFEYRDVSTGDYRRFNGTEEIVVGGSPAYRLIYCGGTVRK